MFFNHHETGLRIRELRLLKGLTQEELAIKCGYKSKTSINQIEAGRRSCLPCIEVLSEVLDTTPPSLLGFEDRDFVINKIKNMPMDELEKLYKYLKNLKTKSVKPQNK